ncbi:MAG: HAMP domain-containing histidine kinase [Saprospiraceae bacterium]|nr:HAMP domain-containing histidine kinase [Saprospiraceae bacterium]
MSNASIWKVVLSAALAIVTICIVQGFWLTQTFSHASRTFEEKVHISLRNVAKELSDLQQVQLPSSNLITQIADDYYVVNIRDAIDAANLEYYLLKEFELVALNTDFEYGLYDCDTDQMVYGNYVSSTAGTIHKPVDTELAKHEDLVYYFGVRFPDRLGYLLNNQWLPILFTLLLFIAALFFVYATFEIFKQKKLSELQKDFVNNLTHEFKTPLTSIQISSEVLLGAQELIDNPRFEKYLQIIKDQAARLSGQVERVLQISDIRSTQFQLDIELVDVHDLVRNIEKQMSSLVAGAGATLVLSLQSNNTMIHADKLHLSNIICNLLDNALKYSQTDPKVKISTSDTGSALLLRIWDQGIGIDPEDLKRLGQRFFRVSTGNVHNVKGFGLGLYYVRQIVEAHGWHLKISSQKGIGTQINITIPR